MNIMIGYIVLISSLGFLITGYYFRTGEKKDKVSMGSKDQPLGISPMHFSAIGWVLFGLYWILHVPDFLDDGDIINAFLCLAALPFFGYISSKEWKTAKSDGLEGLRFLSGITIITMGAYTIISGVPAVEGTLEYINAYLVAAFLSFFGFPARAGGIDFSGNPLWYRVNDLFISVPIYHDGNDDIHITLSCTAFPSILLFSAAIFCAREPRIIKVKAFMLTVPVIFVFNIIRMSIIAYLVYAGITSGDFAHHVLGKAGSLLALVFLAWVLFTFLPSILDSLGEVFDIILGPKKKTKKRKKSGVDNKKNKRKPDKWRQNSRKMVHCR